LRHQNETERALGSLACSVVIINTKHGAAKTRRRMPDKRISSVTSTTDALALQSHHHLDERARLKVSIQLPEVYFERAKESKERVRVYVALWIIACIRIDYGL
jgi:hypothetical protein